MAVVRDGSLALPTLEDDVLGGGDNSLVSKALFFNGWLWMRGSSDRIFIHTSTRTKYLCVASRCSKSSIAADSRTGGIIVAAIP